MLVELPRYRPPEVAAELPIAIGMVTAPSSPSISSVTVLGGGALAIVKVALASPLSCMFGAKARAFTVLVADTVNAPPYSVDAAVLVGVVPSVV